MSYPADPGGIFASDVHRRVMAALNPEGEPLPADELLEGRIAGDDFLDIDDESDLVEVLEDLEADGHAKQLKDGWKHTPAGFEALTGPSAEDT